MLANRLHILYVVGNLLSTPMGNFIPLNTTMNGVVTFLLRSTASNNQLFSLIHQFHQPLLYPLSISKLDYLLFVLFIILPTCC